MAAYAERIAKPLMQSISSLDRRFFPMLAYDILFLLVAIAVALGAVTAIDRAATAHQDIFLRTNIVMAQLQNAAPSDAAALTAEAENIRIAFRELFWTAGLVALAAYLVALFFLSLFKGLIWSQILKQKFDRAFFRKFVQLNYILWMAGLLALILLLRLIKMETLVIYLSIGMALFFYILLNTYSLFDKKESVWKILKNGLRTSAIRIHLFIVPYLIIFAVGLLVYWIVSMLIRYLPPVPFLAVTIGALFLLAVMVWVRFYIYENIKLASHQ